MVILYFVWESFLKMRVVINLLIFGIRFNCFEVGINCDIGIILLFFLFLKCVKVLKYEGVFFVIFMIGCISMLVYCCFNIILSFFFYVVLLCIWESFEVNCYLLVCLVVVISVLLVFFIILEKDCLLLNCVMFIYIEWILFLRGL